jgi:hypothetical protein
MKIFAVLGLVVVGAVVPVLAVAENFGDTESEDGSQITRVGSEMTYSWDHETQDGRTLRFETTLNFRRGWDHMQAVYRRCDHNYTNVSKFVLEDPFRADLNVLANSIRRVALGNGLRDVDVALSFVQSLPYQEMGDYQRYAVEVLIDGKGDCSETAVLLGG